MLISKRIGMYECLVLVFRQRKRGGWGTEKEIHCLICFVQAVKRNWVKSRQDWSRPISWTRQGDLV